MNPQSLRDPRAEKAAVKPDAALLALVEEFNEVQGQVEAAHDEWMAGRNRIDALPDCPTPGSEQYSAFLDERGDRALYDRTNDLWKRRGALANRISATPAQTVSGAVEKLKIVRLALGDVADGGDHAYRARRRSARRGLLDRYARQVFDGNAATTRKLTAALTGNWPRSGGAFFVRQTPSNIGMRVHSLRKRGIVNGYGKSPRRIGESASNAL